MQFNHYLIIFSIIVLICANCQSNDTEESNLPSQNTIDTLSYEVIEQDLKEEQEAEIYKIEKKAVIFFMIDRQEAKRLAHELGDSYRWETDALFNGFIEQSREFSKIARKHNIQSGLVHNKRFQIILKNGKSVFFDREKDDQIMGEILSDGEKEPLIKFGMYRNRELASLIEEFFEIKNLGYIPPDTLELPAEEVKDTVIAEEIAP